MVARRASGLNNSLNELQLTPFCMLARFGSASDKTAGEQLQPVSGCSRTAGGRLYSRWAVIRPASDYTAGERLQPASGYSRRAVTAGGRLQPASDYSRRALVYRVHSIGVVYIYIYRHRSPAPITRRPPSLAGPHHSPAGCVVPLREDWVIFSHSGIGWVCRVWSAREKSLQILCHGWGLYPGAGPGAKWVKKEAESVILAKPSRWYRVSMHILK